MFLMSQFRQYRILYQGNKTAQKKMDMIIRIKLKMIPG